MEGILRKSLLRVAPIVFALAACGAPEEPAEDVTLDESAAIEEAAAEPRQAMAALTTADGQSVGTAVATQASGSVMITLEAMNMPPGPHGVHVHEVGMCEAPGFQTAGGHWNPTDQAHGLENPAGQHAGDMANLEIGEDGTGSLEYTLQGGADFAGLTEGDGSAFIIHSGRDDQVTDPSGDSGERIACGVFTLAGTDS